MTELARPSPISRLRAFARPAGATAVAEWCDVCGAGIGPEHAHLVSPGALALSCACLACSASPPPGLLLVAPCLVRVDAERAGLAWERLGLPVGLGFVLLASAPERRWIARLPGVAGATLAELSTDAEGVLSDVVPAGLRPDVEALLVDRTRRVAFVVSIDRCFELTGLLRARGDAEPFFTALAEAAGTVMADLAFRVVGAAPLEHAATPIVSLRVVIQSRAPVRAILLRCLVRIDAGARAYDADETRELEPVLGPANRSVTAPLVWAQLAQSLPAFDGELGFDLELPCSLDLRTGAAAYLDALDGGTIPLTVLFSGTVFHAGEGGALAARPIPQTAEVKFPLPVAVCREALVRHHGDATLLPVRRDVLARLRRFAAGRPTARLDDAIARLLDLAEAGK